MVSVVVVTLERLELLLAAVESLARQTYPSIEIIVVDNGSVATSRISQEVQKRYPAVICLRNETNLGFAGGNNVGIRKATGDYIALLNNDAVADSDWVEQMVAVMEGDESIGAVASVVRDGHAPDRLDSFGVGVALDGMSRQLCHGDPLPLDGPPRDVLAFSGCACLIRRSALDQVGLLDERFFAYCEDTDLSLRLLHAGWRIVATPRAKITHYYSQSSGPFSIRKVFWIERNHYWVAIKNFHWLLVLLLPLVTLWRVMLQLRGSVGKSSVSGFIDTAGMRQVVWTILRANVAMWMGMLAVLAARRRCAGNGGGRDGLVAMWRQRMTLTEIILGDRS